MIYHAFAGSKVKLNSNFVDCAQLKSSASEKQRRLERERVEIEGRLKDLEHELEKKQR